MEKDKFCRCVKSVRKTLKARKGSTPEQGAIAVCVKSVLQTRGRTLKKFRCGKKAMLKTQKMKRRGGVHGVFGWASVNGNLDKMLEIIERKPENTDTYVAEAFKMFRKYDIPAVTEKTRDYYNKAIEKTAPYPALQEYLKSMEQGSAWLRRGPLVSLRRAVLAEYND